MPTKRVFTFQSHTLDTEQIDGNYCRAFLFGVFEKIIKKGVLQYHLDNIMLDFFYLLLTKDLF